VTFRILRSLRRAAPLLGAAAVLSLGLAACGKKEDVSPEQASLDKGRTLYTLRCASCHHPADPRKDGAIGPAIAGSSAELLDARLNRNGYPEGYAPKRATQVMPKLPTTPDELQALHAFLNSF
jgi:mono/diheme cytochrome c family protein